MSEESNEPDWESLCKTVQIGDTFYWDCMARREELEMLEEIRNEPPFEDRLMQRAQDIPELPGKRKPKPHTELTGEDLTRMPSAPPAPAPRAASGISGLLEGLAAGDTGKYVLVGGSLALLGLWWYFQSQKNSAETPQNATAYPVAFKNGKQVLVAWFSDPEAVKTVAKLAPPEVRKRLEGGKKGVVPEGVKVDTLKPEEFVEQARKLLLSVAA